MDSLKHDLKVFIGSHSKDSGHSTFFNDGKITPLEFMLTAEQFIQKCPRWHWASGDPSVLGGSLPAEKQYLVLTDIPCRSRPTILKGQTLTSTAGDDEPDIVGEAPEEPASKEPEPASSSSDEEEEEEEEETFPGMSQPSSGTAEAATVPPGFRRYEANVVYDKFYNCAHLYLRGFDENGQPLTDAQLFEDVSEEYRDKTATVEKMPYTHERFLSIHPCKHASTMKAMIDRARDNKEVFKVESYLFYFLKLIAAAVPTIEISSFTDYE